MADAPEPTHNGHINSQTISVRDSEMCDFIVVLLAGAITCCQTMSTPCG